jgi:hypothetical protein
MVNSKGEKWRKQKGKVQRARRTRCVPTDTSLFLVV